MKPQEISKGVYSVGVNDWDINDFHGYSTPFGTSYNAFLIIDEKIALIDTVRQSFSEELLDNIARIVDPKKIDYVISNHSELDHSGGLPQVMQAIGDNTPLFCSKMGQKNLSQHFRNPWNYHAVTNGEELSLGKKTLTFLEARMLHWPDSMFTYYKEEKILFSSDAFGQHYASNEKYNDVVGGVVMEHAKKYFANILMHFSPQVLKMIKTISMQSLELNMICPDHGLIWKKDMQQIIDAYVRWSMQHGRNKAVLVYDSMWHSTEMMANAITSGLENEGIEVRPMNLRKWHRSDIMTEVLDAKVVLVGSPTLNNGLYPTVSDMLTYMKGLRPKNKIVAAFGSYGWSGEGVRLINNEFEAMKLTIIDEGLRIQYVPDSEDIEKCVAFGKKIGREIMDNPLRRFK